jgi:predicted DNA-binding transcriptional regulator AlpA
MKHQRLGLTRGVVGSVSSIARDTLEPTASDSSDQPPTLILWGWPEILASTGIPRRTLEQAINAGQFPAPTVRLGRRPYWAPDRVRNWARGGKP